MLGDMTIQRRDNVGVVVDVLAAAFAFFVELGLELEGKTTVEGPWVDRSSQCAEVRIPVCRCSECDGDTTFWLKAPA